METNHTTKHELNKNMRIKRKILHLIAHLIWTHVQRVCVHRTVFYTSASPTYTQKLELKWAHIILNANWAKSTEELLHHSVIQYWMCIQPQINALKCTLKEKKVQRRVKRAMHKSNNRNTETEPKDRKNIYQVQVVPVKLSPFSSKKKKSKREETFVYISFLCYIHQHSRIFAYCGIFLFQMQHTGVCALLCI